MKRASGWFIYVAVVACFTLAVARTAHGQASTGGIRGLVKDNSGGILVGVTVEATSPSRIGGAAVGITNDQGLYRLENLAVGVYTVSFTLQGFETLRREEVRVEVGRTVDLPAVLAVGAMEQSVVVTGSAPVVDTTHAGYSSNFNQQLLENIPTSRTSWFDVVTAAPAVRSDPVSANSATFLLYGSSSDQNSYQNDGVEVAAPSGGTVWSFPNPDTIEEVQVLGVGASAEYAGFQGGVVNIITKSGSNRLKGTANYFYTGGGLVGNNSPGEEFPYHIAYQSDFTFSLGGPIKKDKLWLIGMIELTNNKTSDIGVDPATAPVNHNYKPFVKVNGRPSTTDSFEFQFSDEYFRLPESPDILDPANTIRDENGHNPIFVGRWTRTFGNKTLLEAKGGGIYIRDHFDPHSGDFTTPGRVDTGTGVASVNTTELHTLQNQNQTSLSATLSRSADNFIKGSHDFKFGVQYAQGTNLQNQGLTGGQSFLDYYGLPYRMTVRTTSSVIGRVRTAGGFAQDNWTPSERVTLNLGVRFDHSMGDIPATDQLDPTFSNSVDTYAGLSDVIGYNNTSPRVGATVKLDRTGKTVAKASFGRYYARLNTGLFTAIAPGGAITQTYNYNPKTSKYDLLFNTTNPKQNQTIDPNLTNEYDDQLYIGLERELLPDLGLNLSYIRKQEKNFIRGLDIGSIYAPRAIADTFGGQTLTVYNRTTPSAQVLVEPTNRDDFRQKYDTVVLQAYKRLSHRWQLQGSYQWENSEGFSTGATTSTQSGPGTFGADPNQLVNAYGRFPTDSAHSVRVSSTVELPYQIQLAIRSVYESGRPYGRLITARGLAQGTENVLAEPRGAFELPARNDLSIRVGKDITIGGQRLLRLNLDVQNLFNSDTPLSIDNNSSHTTTYLAPTSIFLPRRLILGARVNF
ncbi:MAG: TonB-dependent receptor [Vicinamibacterales bacterium]